MFAGGYKRGPFAGVVGPRRQVPGRAAAGDGNPGPAPRTRDRCGPGWGSPAPGWRQGVLFEIVERWEGMRGRRPHRHDASVQSWHDVGGLPDVRASMRTFGGP
jgi:hypothetical protein